MTWLHKFFGLFFIPGNGRAKLAQQLISMVQPFHPLYFPWVQGINKKHWPHCVQDLMMKMRAHSKLT